MVSAGLMTVSNGSSAFSDEVRWMVRGGATGGKPLGGGAGGAFFLAVNKKQYNTMSCNASHLNQVCWHWH